MNERDRNEIVKDQSVDELDRLLDATLAKYAASEPRPGLDQRIIANLRAEQSRASVRFGWRWALVAGAVAIAVFAMVLIWKPSRPGKPNIANGGSPRPAPSPQVQTQVAESGSPRGRVGTPQHGGVVRRPRPQVAASAPKLDQFPSPQPLSTEEIALAQYVKNFPKEAQLVAQAQEEFALETQRIMNDAGSESRPSTSIQQER